MFDSPLSPKKLLGFVSITAGVILTVFCWELSILWFQGGPLGIVLIGLGVLDLWEARRHTHRGAHQGLLQKLHDELMGPSLRSKPSQHGGRAALEDTVSSSTEDEELDSEESSDNR